MSSTDDAYANYNCGNSLWGRSHSPVFFADGGNFLLGISRLASFIVLYALNAYNRRLLRKKADDNTNVVPNLILPYYFNYFKLFIFVSLMAGIVDLAIQLSSVDDGAVNNWLVPFEQGIFHWLFEGLAFFLMRYGSGVRAMRLSLYYSTIWGVISFVMYFILFSMLAEQYGFNNHKKGKIYAVFITYDLVLFIFYAVLSFAPMKYVYRREALLFYARFNVFYYLVFIIIGTLIYKNVEHTICVASVFIFILVGIVQPIILFRTLQIDSQYWQGLKPDPRNPMLAVWDHVDIPTAQSMAENMDAVATMKLPVLHFGLLDIEKSDHFVPGGFSRVYFGTLRKEKVAIKILFAMELTPIDVANFYSEAALLHSLKHPNVVECKGICTMPPALAMVLENCRYGSLFDFIYKPINDENLRQQIAHNQARRSFISGGALSSLQAAISSGPLPERNSLTTSSNTQSNANNNNNATKRLSLVQTLANRMSLQTSVFRPSTDPSYKPEEKEQELTTTSTAPNSLRDSQYIMSLPSLLSEKTQQVSTDSDDDHVQNPILTQSSRSEVSQQSTEGSTKSMTTDSTPHISVDTVESSNNLRASTVGIDISSFQHHATITGKDRLTFSSASGSNNNSSKSGLPDGVRPSQLSSIDIDEDRDLSAKAHEKKSALASGLPPRLSSSSESASYSRYSQVDRSSYASTSASSSRQPQRGSVANFLQNVSNRLSMRAPNTGTNTENTTQNNANSSKHLNRLGQGISSLFDFSHKVPAERESMIAQVTMGHSISMHDRITMMRDAIAGIAFLHSRGVLHCDIKSLNFLVDENFRVKLADLGEARRISAMGDFEKPPSPSRNWAPPEIVPKFSPSSNYTVKSEVYGVCIIVAELALLELPFGELPERVTLRSWYDKLAVDRVRPILPEDMPKELREIVELGMETDPELRPSIEDLLAAFEEYIHLTTSQRELRQSDKKDRSTTTSNYSKR